MSKTLLLAVTIVAGLATLSLTRRDPAARALSLEQRRAFDHLLKLGALDSPHVGAIGNLSREALAFRIVLERQDAQSWFAQLVERGQVGGRLLGLCGLKLTRSSGYPAALEALKKETGRLEGMQGCMLGATRAVTDVVSEIETKALCDGYAGLDESAELRATYRSAGFQP